jgi:MinD-like ATPase involved in chromosome partitioning or flagellar assembly
VAVNLASTARTSVNDSRFTSDEITSAASTVLADTEAGPNEELWMAFLLLALLLVVVEWVTYHRRLTV